MHILQPNILTYHVQCHIKLLPPAITLTNSAFATQYIYVLLINFTLTPIISLNFINRPSFIMNPDSFRYERGSGYWHMLPTYINISSEHQELEISVSDSSCSPVLQQQCYSLSHYKLRFECSVVTRIRGKTNYLQHLISWGEKEP